MSDLKLGLLALGLATLACVDQPRSVEEIGGSETQAGTSAADAGSSSGEDSGASSGEDSSASSSEDSSDSSDSGTASESDSGSETGVEPPMLPLCGTPPPEGAQLAPPLPSYGGQCPQLVSGQSTTIATGGGDRSFIFVAPSEVEEGEELPVMFMFHWLGASASSFFDRAEVQAAADYYRFIAIIPDGRDVEDLVPFRWPFAITDLDLLMDQDFQMVDDLLACAAEQFSVDKECVSAMGVSAGAMFTSMLASRHGDRLASMISLSGGVGGLIKPWQPGGNIMPAMVLWGGDDDFCIAIDFASASPQLEQDLENNGHPVLECIHNCTHATPPFEAPLDQPDLPTFAPTWEFMLAHPYWLEDGDSPYADFEELPSPWPDWCAMGAGNAVERVGVCGGSECE